jgi:hypothetical protein
MKIATTIVQIIIRLTWLILLVLGLLFWTGRDQTLVPAHAFLGLAFAFALWALAYLGVRCELPPGLVATVVLWGVVVPVVGMTQTRILTGSFHWIIQVLHLLVGFAAIALAESVCARIKRRLAGSV